MRVSSALGATISLSNVKAVGFIYLFFYHACTRRLVLNTSTLEPYTSLEYWMICPRGIDGNGRAYQNRFKARLISRSAQIKPLALSEPSTDEQTRERNELRSNTCLTYARAKEKGIFTSININWDVKCSCTVQANKRLLNYYNMLIYNFMK